MNVTSKSLYLLHAAKAVRMFASGILIIVFLQNLIMKDIAQTNAVLIQASAYIGTIIITQILKANIRRVGTKNIALIGSLIMIITATAFSEVRSSSLLFLLGITGIMPVIGQQIELFCTIQKTCITKLSLNQSKAEQNLVTYKSLSNYQLIGTISKILGCLSCLFLYYKGGFTSILNDEKQHLYLVRIYTLLCSLHFLIYLNVDSIELQSIWPQKKGFQVSKQDINSNVRVGLVRFVNLFVQIGVSLMNLTNFSYFVHRKYQLTFQAVIALIAGIIAINFIGKKLAKKVIQVWGFTKISLFFIIISNTSLIYVAFTQRLLSIQLLIFAINFLANQILIAALQEIQKEMVTKEELQRNQETLWFLKILGTIVSILVYSAFIIAETTKATFSGPILVAAGAKTVSAIALISFMRCLGNYSYGGKREQNGIDRDEHQHSSSQKERLHSPCPHSH